MTRYFSTSQSDNEGKCANDLGKNIKINMYEEDSIYNGPPLIEPKYSYEFKP